MSFEMTISKYMQKNQERFGAVLDVMAKSLDPPAI